MVAARSGAPAQLATLLAGFAWRASRLNALGRLVVGRADSHDDDVRRLAMMALVSAGDRGVDQVADAYERGSTSTDLPRVLSSIGTPRARRLLVDLTSSDVEQVRTAAEQALADLTALDRHGGDDLTG